jgi:hypothetical protein
LISLQAKQRIAMIFVGDVPCHFVLLWIKTFATASKTTISIVGIHIQPRQGGKNL